MPGPLAQWMQFPKLQQGPGQEQDVDETLDQGQAMLLKSLRGQQPLPKKPQPGVQGGMPQAYGTPSPTAQPMQTTNANARPMDDIEALIERLKGGLDERPSPLPAGGPPQRPQLPDRPQQRGVDIIPQLFAGAGTIFSGRSYHPQNYLGEMQAMQKGKRDEAHQDEINRRMSDYQGAKEQYADTLMRHEMERREIGEKYGRAQSLMQDLLVNRSIQGVPSPGQALDLQKREKYLAEGKAAGNNIQDIKEWAARSVAIHPTDKDMIQEVAQALMAGSKAVPTLGERIREAIGTATPSQRGRSMTEILSRSMVDTPELPGKPGLVGMPVATPEEMDVERLKWLKKHPELLKELDERSEKFLPKETPEEAKKRKEERVRSSMSSPWPSWYQGSRWQGDNR